MDYRWSTTKSHIYGMFRLPKNLLLLYCVPTLIYIYIKFLQISINPVQDLDNWSIQYSLFDLQLYMVKPFTYPLLIKLFNYNMYKVAAFQVVFSATSWIFLAFSTSKLLANYAVKFISYITILFLSLSVTITQWDTIIRSESISFSLFAIFLGLNILLITNKSNKKILYLIIAVVGVLFSFARDSNAYIILQVSIFYSTLYIVLVILKYAKDITILKQYIYYISLAFFLFVTYLIQQIIIKLSNRTQSNLINIFSKRILTNQEYTEYFVTKWNMPLNENIYKCCGHWSSDNECRYANQSTFHNWVSYRGFEAYRSFLTSHLVEIITTYWSLIPSSLNYTTLYNYCYTQDPLYKNVYFYIPQQIFYASLWDSLFFFFLTMAAIMILIFVMRPYFINSYLTRYLIIINLFFVSLGQVFIGYFGDSMEVERHSLLAGISFKLAFIILIFIIFELIFLNYLNFLNFAKSNPIKLIVLLIIGIIATCTILTFLPEPTDSIDYILELRANGQ